MPARELLPVTRWLYGSAGDEKSWGVGSAPVPAGTPICSYRGYKGRRYPPAPTSCFPAAAPYPQGSSEGPRANARKRRCRVRRNRYSSCLWGGCTDTSFCCKRAPTALLSAPYGTTRVFLLSRQSVLSAGTRSFASGHSLGGKSRVWTCFRSRTGKASAGLAHYSVVAPARPDARTVAPLNPLRVYPCQAG